MHSGHSGKIGAFVLFLLSILFFLPSAHAACHPYSRLIKNGAYGVADSKGRLLSACNQDIPLIPASILKVPTALAALQILGRDYRFITRFYVDSRQNLYIKGFGDPLLTSEEVRLIMTRLKEKGLTRVNAIFIDSSNFDLHNRFPGRGGSSNPYDAPFGALAVNFNSTNILVDKRHGVTSNEPQTPTLPIMREIGRKLPPGRHLRNICGDNCNIDIMMTRYAAELFRAMQREVAIPGDGEIGALPVPADARLVYEHKNSKNLEEILLYCLKYSSNFTANLIYLTSGAKRYGYPATWIKAGRAVHEKLVELVGEKNAAQLNFVEGSGLDRRNRVTARAMLAVLRAFRPHASLLPEKRGVVVKSGTLAGVSTYAGYLDGGNAFVILLNQEKNNRDTVLDRLKTLYSKKR